MKRVHLFIVKMFIENLLGVKLYTRIWGTGCCACTCLFKVGKPLETPSTAVASPLAAKGNCYTNFLHMFFILLLAFLKILECKISHEKDCKYPLIF